MKTAGQLQKMVSVQRAHKKRSLSLRRKARFGQDERMLPLRQAQHPRCALDSLRGNQLKILHIAPQNIANVPMTLVQAER